MGRKESSQTNKQKMEKQYFLHLVVRQGDSAGCLPEQELSVFFTERRAHLKTSKHLSEPSFYGYKLFKFDNLCFRSY